MTPQNKTAPGANRRGRDNGGSANNNGIPYHSSTLVAKAELAAIITGDHRPAMPIASTLA
jgi:hypothetical protein